MPDDDEEENPLLSSTDMNARRRIVLFNLTFLQDNLTFVPYIARICDYGNTRDFFGHFLTQLVSSFQQRDKMSKQQQDVISKQIAWLIHLIGAAVNGKTLIYTPGENEAVDGQLISAVLRFIAIADSRDARTIDRSPEGADAMLEVSIISFMQSVQLVYLVIL